MARFVLNLHAQRQPHRRGISYEDVDLVLENYDSRRPARIGLSNPPSEIFVGTVRGRRLRVYVVIRSDQR
jgi:hypothetical protein